MPVDCFCRCANRSKVFSPNEQREKSSRNRKKFHVPTDNYDTTRSMMVVKIYQRMSHRNLVARKTTFHSPRATPFSFLPRSKKNFSYRTMIVKFFSENEGQLATTENQLTSKRQSICEREIQSQFSTKNQRLTSFHISNLRAFWRRSWKTGNTFLGRKIPYARDIYIYIIFTSGSSATNRSTRFPISFHDVFSTTRRRSLEYKRARNQMAEQRESRSRKDGAKWIEYRSAKDKIVSRRYYRFSLVPYSLPRLCERAT